MKEYLVPLLNEEDMAKEMGKKARQTIVENYSAEKFVNKWNRVLDLGARKFYRG